MQVILQQSVHGLGMVGDVVSVRDGYFRNFLSPRRLALEANTSRVKQWEHHKKVVEAKKEKARGGALELKSRLEAQPLKVEHAAGANDKLFGSLTVQEIVRVLKEGGFQVDRRLVLLEAPIKTTGRHEVGVKLHPDVVAKVIIEVVPKAKETKS